MNLPFDLRASLIDGDCSVTYYYVLYFCPDFKFWRSAGIFSNKLNAQVKLKEIQKNNKQVRIISERFKLELE